jgi:hypothetical protein
VTLGGSAHETGVPGGIALRGLLLFPAGGAAGKRAPFAEYQRIHGEADPTFPAEGGAECSLNDIAGYRAAYRSPIGSWSRSRIAECGGQPILLGGIRPAWFAPPDRVTIPGKA